MSFGRTMLTCSITYGNSVPRKNHVTASFECNTTYDNNVTASFERTNQTCSIPYDGNTVAMKYDVIASFERTGQTCSITYGNNVAM